MSGMTADCPALTLKEWFDQVGQLLDDALFGIVPAGPHREAMVLGVLSRTARELRESVLDDSERVFTPLILLLTAACKRTGCTLSEGNWQAALENVEGLTQKLSEHDDQAVMLGIDLGSAASQFKQQLDEALLHSGLAGQQSFLDEENRQLALGLAINWGLRFLLAHSLETATDQDRPQPDEGRRDLGWIAAVITPPKSRRGRSG